MAVSAAQREHRSAVIGARDVAQCPLDPSLESEWQKLQSLLGSNSSRLAAATSEDSTADHLTPDSTSVRQLIVERLSLLRRSDWLRTVCQLLPDEQFSTTEASADRLALYEAIKDVRPIDLAVECVVRGNVELVGTLVNLFPFSLLPHFFTLLSSLVESSGVHDTCRILEIIIDRCRLYGQGGGPPPPREPDSLEHKEVLAQYGLGDAEVLTESACRCLVPDSWIRNWEREVETWIVQRALEIDRVTGLYLDSIQLLRDGQELLEKQGFTSSVLRSQVKLGQEFEVFLMLKDYVNRLGVCSNNRPSTLVDYTASESQDRLVYFMQLAMSVDAEHVGDICRAYLSTFVRIQAEMNPNAEEVLKHLLVETAYSNMEWIVSFVKNEAAGKTDVFPDKASVGMLCCEILRHEITQKKIHHGT